MSKQKETKQTTVNLVNLNQVQDESTGSCGYCSNNKSGKWTTSGLICKLMGAQEYKDLMDRGWRRCGTYYYKANLDQCCCRPYTIRMDAPTYKMKHSQQQVVKKFDNFLKNNNEENQNFQNNNQKNLNPQKQQSNKKMEQEEEKKIDNKKQQNQNNKEQKQGQQQQKLKLEQQLSQFTPEQKQQQEIIMNTLNKLENYLVAQAKNIFTVNNEQGENIMIGNLIPLNKHKNKVKIIPQSKTCKKILGANFYTNFLYLFFLENEKEFESTFGIKNLLKMIEISSEKISEYYKRNFTSLKILVQSNGYISFGFGKEEIILNQPYKNTLKTNKSLEREKQQKQGLQEEILNKKSQQDLLQKQVEKQESSTIPKKKLTIKLEKAKYDEESFDIYKKYCYSCHQSTKETPQSYTNFLCLQALDYSEKTNANGKTLPYGCYHQKYYLENKLIAVGVVDIVPEGLSSVYFFYDPEYKKYSLGVLGSIKEIEWVQEMQKEFPEFKYYYLGYYIQSCKKMVYKADYQPAQLLCPTTYTWVEFDDNIKNVIDKYLKSSRLSKPEIKIIDDMDFSKVNVAQFVNENIKLNLDGRILKLTQINPAFVTYFQEIFKNLVIIFGKKISSKLQFGQY